MALIVLRNPRREVEIEGPKRVKAVLRDLGLHPDAVLVIRGEELLTREDVINNSDTIEVRAVISGGAPEPKHTKCRRCREKKAVVELARHNTAFCKDCFLHFFRNQVERAIKHEDMLHEGDKVLVAVSGGKDSLALWDVLIDLGYDTTGFHIVLWTGEEYAPESLRASQAYADSRGVELKVSDIREEFGFAIPDLPHDTGRPTCGACGLTKRHLISKAASDGNYDVIAVGHNLDDEAAVLLGNTLRWDMNYLSRQRPVLDADNGFVKKIKPLHRLSEKETATYAFLQHLDYVVEECPLVAGNTQMRYKLVLDQLEAAAPGTKTAFYQGFVDRARDAFATAPTPHLNACIECGMPTPGDTCAFCRMVEIKRKRSEARA